MVLNYRISNKGVWNYSFIYLNSYITSLTFFCSETHSYSQKYLTKYVLEFNMAKYIPRAFVLMLFLMSGVSKVIDYSFYEKDMINGWGRLDSYLKDYFSLSLPISSSLVSQYSKPILHTIGVIMTLTSILAFFGSKRSVNVLIMTGVMFIVLIHDPFLFDDVSERDYNYGQMLLNVGVIGGLMLLNE